MNNFDFLKGIELPEPEKGKRTVVAKELEGDFRISKNGKFAFKSDEYANTFFDFFISDDLFGYPEDKPKVLFLSPLDERKPRVDIDASKTGSSYIKKNYAKFAEFFGIDPEETTMFEISFNDAVDFPKMFLGKPIAKGDKKGALSYVVREDVKLIPCSLHESFVQYTQTETVEEPLIIEEDESTDKNWVEDTSGDIRENM